MFKLSLQDVLLDAPTGLISRLCILYEYLQKSLVLCCDRDRFIQKIQVEKRISGPLFQLFLSKDQLPLGDLDSSLCNFGSDSEYSGSRETLCDRQLSHAHRFLIEPERGDRDVHQAEADHRVRQQSYLRNPLLSCFQYRSICCQGRITFQYLRYENSHLKRADLLALLGRCLTGQTEKNDTAEYQ